MLHWQEENGIHLGFEDDALYCRVYPMAEGWTYDNLPEEVEYTGYTTAEEAKAVAEEDYALWVIKKDPEADECELIEALLEHCERGLERYRTWADSIGLYD